MKICYATICDVNYLAPALTLYRSLKKVSAHSFRFYTLDEDAAEYMESLKLPGAEVFAPDDYIPDQVMALKATRSNGAFAFTVKPIALLHAMQTGYEYEWVGHLDVDIHVFSDPGIIISPLDHSKAASLTPHRFSTSFQTYEPTAGRFNAGYVAFRNNIPGKEVLQDWCDLCIEWCHDYVEGVRYGDQKYLENLADNYDSVDICIHNGANAAPWNIAGRTISVRDQEIYIDDDPLLFYHFQGLKVYGPRSGSLYASPELIVKDRLRDLIYEPYVKALYESYHRLSGETAWEPAYTKRAFRTKLRGLLNKIKGEPNNLYRYQV
ncbi:hypothetical protein ACFL7E_05010 [Thermodesulfobacteriota bacterium]